MNRCRAIRLLMVAAFVMPAALSQDSRLQHSWVFFADKPRLDASITAASLGITDRALHRRAKVLPSNRLIDESDLPVRNEYKALFIARGIRIVGESRWLNALFVEAVPSQLEFLRSMPSVLRVAEAGRSRRVRIEPE